MNRLKELRLSRDLTLMQLAEKLEVDYSTLGHIERGRRGFSMESLQKACAFFGVSADYMLGKSPEEMFNGFIDSLRSDWLIEKKDGDDVVQDLSPAIPEPLRSKIQILLMLQEINRPKSLELIYQVVQLKRAQEDFSGED